MQFPIMVYLFLAVRNPRPMGQKIAAFYTEDMDQEEIHTSSNFLHSCFPCCQTQFKPMDSEDPSSISRKLDACQILLKIERKNALSTVC
jgi:hypothetical protein